jgi:hypothetical protein
MTMLADEVTDMNDYGYFIDIDNLIITTDRCVEKDNYIYKNRCEREILSNETNYYLKKKVNSGLFFVNVFCFVTTSIIFIRAWLFSPKR